MVALDFDGTLAPIVADPRRAVAHPEAAGVVARLADGVGAARTIPDAPCRPRFEPRLRDARLCYPCHEPTHG